jgi:hypothetical protein
LEDETIELLRDIRAYARSQAATASREVASKTIDTREKTEVYERLDGTRTHNDIGRLIGVPRKTVTNWIREFVRTGLAVDVPGSNDRALFTLAELNISSKSLERKGKQSRPGRESLPRQTGKRRQAR